jgi:hypothetical protein
MFSFSSPSVPFLFLLKAVITSHLAQDTHTPKKKKVPIFLIWGILDEFSLDVVKN